VKRKTAVSTVLALLMVFAVLACRAPKTKQIVINSEPQGATVFIDGEVVGQTPLKRDLTYKDYKSERRVIIVKKKGYMPQQRYHYYSDSTNVLFQLDKME